MNCPFCQSDGTKVIDSRSSREGYVIRRRRACGNCGSRFTTYEKMEEMLPVVIKKDEARETFDRSKVTRGIQQACQKRPISVQTIEELTDSLEKHLIESAEKEIASGSIGEWILQQLRSLDQVAYVRFASVYREFENVDEFMAELQYLQTLNGGSTP